jgi:hypothetical protein
MQRDGWDELFKLASRQIKQFTRPSEFFSTVPERHFLVGDPVGFPAFWRGYG